MGIRLFPHGENEFDSAKELAEWLQSDFKVRNGVYHVRTADKYTGVSADDLVIFCRDGLFVGEAWVKKPLRRYRKPKGDYEGEIVFYPETIAVYRRRARFDDLRQTLGIKIFPMAIQRLSPAAYRTVVRP
jgi:hypothetical protein